MPSESRVLLARALKALAQGSNATVIRKGEITGVNGDGTVSTTINGDSMPVDDVQTVSHYDPKVGDQVRVEVTDGEPTVIGTTGQAGATAAFATVATSEKGPNGSTYGNCTTVGPSVSVVVGASGLLKVTLSATMTESDSNDGGRMGVDLILGGSTVVAADDSRCLAFFPKTTGAYQSMSRTLWFAGLTPGSYTATARYKDSGGDNLYSFREILAEPY